MIRSSYGMRHKSVVLNSTGNVLAPGILFDPLLVRDSVVGSASSLTAMVTIIEATQRQCLDSIRQQNAPDRSEDFQPPENLLI